MDSLIQAQHELHQRIGRTCENLKKAGIEKITLGRIQSTISLLDKKWAQVEEQHAALRSGHWNELKLNDYYTKDFFSLVEEAYLTQRGKLVDYERSLQSKSDGGTSSIENQLVSVRRTALPKIKLPEFSGKYEDWPAFRDHFVSSIDKDEQLPTIEKLHYLRSCVQGEAASMIQNLPATEVSYRKAWKELTDFYENTRLLIRSHFCKFLALQKMKSESASELKKIFHGIVNTYVSLENLGRPVNSSEDLFVHLIVDLLGARTRDLWDEHISDSSDPPSFEKLKVFLQRRLQTLDGRIAAKEAKLDTTTSKSCSSKTAKSHAAQKKDAVKKGAKAERCSLCHKEHFLMFCDAFKGKSATERKEHVSENKLCFNCLGKHNVSECMSKKSCTVCSKRHHSMLHDASRDQKIETSEATTSHVARKRVDKQITILLATARVRVADRFGTLHDVRALIDQGSEASFVSEALAQKLRLPRKATSVSVIGVGGSQTGTAKGKVSLRITSHFNETAFNVVALVLPRLTEYTGGANIQARTWEHLENLELADPKFLASDPVDILLGADVFAAIVSSGVKRGGPQEPVAQKTSLGWIVSGSIASTNEAPNHALSHRCITMEMLNEQVQRFWKQEEPLSATPVLTEDEQRCEDFFIATHTRNEEGRYIVRLPFATKIADLTTTRYAALRSLAQMERRFLRDQKLHHMYKDFMRQYQDLTHMSPASPPANEDAKEVCYLPHHGVLRESSATTKLRVVFNGSLTLASGESLNKHLLTGANLLPALTDVLLLWRTHRYVMASDIEKMYRQILIHPADRNWQRIVWRSNANEKVQDFKLNTVTYGLACAPYLAIRTLRQLATDEASRYPLGAAAIQRNVYVDDILTGANTLQEAQQLQKQLISLCNAGGFPLKKWAANHTKLLSNIPLEDRMPADPREWQPAECHTMLGLRWHPSSDSFSFSVKGGELEPITKRSILSKTAQLFDPLGWLAPVVIRAKILIQSAWLQGLDWDTPLTEKDCQTWRKLQEELQALEKIHIPRWLTGSHCKHSLEMHGFADASERAYAAVVYLRAEGENGLVKVSLIAARSKVAPLKQVSLPRLELCAATLLAQLMAYLIRILDLQNTTAHGWLDSTVALNWVQGHPSRWKTYVANRVAEIQRLLTDVQWHHIRSKDNPADCASRGVNPMELASHILWWQGPPWLAMKRQSWPVATVSQLNDPPEQRKAVVGLTQRGTMESEVLLRFSSLTRLLRVTAWCRRWLPSRRRTDQGEHFPGKKKDDAILTAEELEAAKGIWVRNVQASHFEAELKALSHRERLPTKSSLMNLNPFVDEQGIMRVGGRLKHSLLSFDEKHLAILPAQSHFTVLIIASCHRQTLHGGVQQTLGLLRRSYWVPRGRVAVKHHIHDCLTCVRWRAATPHQIMADLPKQRVTPTRPFQHTGVDYAGPIMLRTTPGRGHKSYKAFIVVFVCMSTKAVHLDVASDYSANAFLAAFRRFTARRGLCQTLYSDCGTNFIGADSQLRSLFIAGNKEAQLIANQLATDQVQWKFNPPSAPHFGGIWEAAVKSLKHHIRRVLGDSTLTYEEMATLLAQVEACLNSRPLQALSDDHDDISALTPGHFLIGTAINAVPEKSHLDTSVSALSRWQHLQYMRDHFWNRWSREYLHGLISRSKWRTEEKTVEIGRLCLILNEGTPPTKWPLARVTKLHPGDDGRIRVVTVKTATSELTRPITKLVLLPRACADRESGNQQNVCG